MLRKKLNNVVATLLAICLLVFSINPMFVLANASPDMQMESNEQIESLQEDLLKAGFEVEGADEEERLHSLTLQMEAFQTYYELPVGEEYVEQLLVYLDELVHHPFQKGQEHENIALLKEYLHTLGYLEEVNETLVFDEKTEEAVIRLQNEYSLIVNGIIDDKTGEVIEELLEELESDSGKSDIIEDETVESEDETNHLEEDVTESQEIIESEYVISEENVEETSDIEEIIEENEQQLATTENDEQESERITEDEQESENISGSSQALMPASLTMRTAIKDGYAKGNRHNDIIQIKKDLAKLGFPVPGNTTNYFGVKTEQQVKAFQKYYSLEVDGFAGPGTQKKLTEQANTPLQKGKRHADTKKLKKDLTSIGYTVPGKGTTLYGADTETTVKKFQQAHNLVINGVADEVTLAKIASLQKEEPSKVAYFKGDRHKDIIQIKKDLAKLGFPVPGNTTNYFGVKTEQQVKAFQKYYSLEVDGFAGPGTQKKLTEQANTPLQKGKRHADTKKLKKDLTSIGYAVPGKGTTLYGADTETTVKKFQQAHNLVINGIADEVTLGKIASLQKEEPTEEPSKVAYFKGDRHKDIIQIKKDLAKLGFPVPGNTTNYFGVKTEQQVKAFQKYYSLEVDGFAGPGTQKKLTEQANTPLQKGKRHNDTKKLKANLKMVGYVVPGKGTTLYGKDTETTVKKFQQAHNLVVNGIADEVTLAKISSLVGTTGNGESGDKKAVKIFIDAGHGGTDSGALGNGLKEKDLTLDIALRIQKHLNQYSGVDVNMSRTTDTTLSLKQRTDMANSWKADFFFSVHINSFSSSSANGFESFIYNNRPTLDEVSKQATIHNHFMNENPGNDRGKKTANFHVLRESNMTAMLAEYYFITNPSDAAKLKSPAIRDEMAKATADGIAKAYGLKRK